MKFYQNITEVIGNTPLIKLNKICEDLEATILAKAEFLNPGGSVKDRIGIAMIRDAENKGKLKPGGTIVEATSGNTGIGLTLAAVQRGYKVIVTMPDKMSTEKELVLRSLGAEVIRTPTNVAPDDKKSYYKVAETIVRTTSNAFSPDQYQNLSNPHAHYETTGPEIWKDTDGLITHFVAGMGTGGTITGVGRFLKEKNDKIKIIGVDPEGSILKHRFYQTEGKPHVYKIEGIGEDLVPATLDFSVIDEVLTVTDKDAYLTARRLAFEEGLLVGSSSGAAVFGSLQIAKSLTSKDLIVVLLPDTGRNYLSTVFNDRWLLKNGLL